MNDLKIDTLYTIKLVTGEEITAKVLSKGVESIELSHPINMVLTPEGLQMVPSMLSAAPGKSVQLNNNSWVMYSETREDVKNSWIEATTGIKTVKKQLLTG